MCLDNFSCTQKCLDYEIQDKNTQRTKLLNDILCVFVVRAMRMKVGFGIGRVILNKKLWGVKKERKIKRRKKRGGTMRSNKLRSKLKQIKENKKKTVVVFPEALKLAVFDGLTYLVFTHVVCP